MITFAVNDRKNYNGDVVNMEKLTTKLLGDIKNLTSRDLEGAASYILAVYDGTRVDKWVDSERSEEIQEMYNLKRVVKPWDTKAYKLMEYRREKDKLKGLCFICYDTDDTDIEGVVTERNEERLRYTVDLADTLYNQDTVQIIRELSCLRYKILLREGKDIKRLMQLALYGDMRSVRDIEGLKEYYTEDVKDCLDAALTSTVVCEMLKNEKYRESLWDYGDRLGYIDFYTPWQHELIHKSLKYSKERRGYTKEQLKEEEKEKR